MSVSLRLLARQSSLLTRKSINIAPVALQTTVSNYRPLLTIAQRPASLVLVRGYAKKVSKKKNTSASESAVSNDENNDSSAAMVFDEKAIDHKFGQVISSLKDQFGALRVGRANPALLDTVRVYIDDTSFSLRDLAQVTIRDPQTLLVSVHDTEYQTAIDKSIREAGLNLNPVIDSKVIRVPIPKPTKESRDKMAKLAAQAAEQMKSRIRLVRQDGMKQLKTDAKTQSKDDIKKMEKLVQTMTDKYNKEIDNLLKSKLKEIQT